MTLVTQEKSTNTILYQYFHEIPDKNLALLALVLLLIVSVISFGLSLWTKSAFTLFIPLTGFLIAAGYACRLHMISNPKLFTFAAMQILLIVPALFLAAVNYTCFGRVINMRRSRSSKVMLWMSSLGFIIFDILCLIIQSFGGTLLTNKDPKIMKVGINLILVGILLAVIVNVFFIGTLIYINTTMSFEVNTNVWIALYVTMGCLLVRNIYRAIEFVQNYISKNGIGYLSSHEIYMYIFDFTMLFICFVVFCLLHYGFYL